MREIQWRRIHALARPGVLLDVGANVGETVIPPIREGLFTAALAAEPEAANFDRLCASVKSADLGDKLACECCAIAESDGEASLYVAAHSKKHHLLRADHAAVRRKVRTVPAFTLDVVVNDAQGRDAVR